MAKKLSKKKAEKILHDKQVKGRSLTEKQRKFFGAVASGAVPKAQIGDMLRPITPESVGKFLDLFSVPQKALTKLVTGKYQTPAEAMDIQNPVAAFGVNAILDPLNIFGGGTIAKSAMARKAAPQVAKQVAKKATTKEPAKKFLPKVDVSKDPYIVETKGRTYGDMIADKIETESQLANANKTIKENYDAAVREKKEFLEQYNEDYNILGKTPSEYDKIRFSIYNDPNALSLQSTGFNLRSNTGDRYAIARGLLGDYSDAYINANLTQGGRSLMSARGEGIFKKSADDFGNFKEVEPWQVFDKNFFIRKNQQGGSIESRMGGLTDKGFNYNGAWGGQFQDGGAIPKAQIGINDVLPTPGQRVNLRATSDNTGAQKNIKEYIPKETVKPSTSKSKDTRHWQSDSRAKERINNYEYEESIVGQTAIDQIPYAPYLLAAKAFNEGRPFTAMSELLKAPKAVGYPYDAMVNIAQENPKGIDIKSFEDRIIPFVRLAANGTFGDSIVEDIGKQVVASETPESRKNLFSASRQYNLPSLFEASKSLGVDNNTLTKFIEENWESSGRSYKNVLDLAKKEFSKKQQGGMLPGVQGHMYARHGAPSEGKYAKKTLPSAAEGYEILPDPTDPERKYKLSALVQSVKETLNPVLRSKNPKAYDEWEKGRIEAIKKGNLQKYDVESPLSIYLTPDEMRTTLSKQNKNYYDEYLAALKELNMFKELGKETYAGQIEGEKPLEDLLYGSRLSTAPVNLGVDEPSGKGFRYAYNPSTGEYKKQMFKGGGKMMSYYQQGLDFQPKTISKKGSKIKKDNAGYWNPDNWGEPVEIDSNEITMQGVYEPLLGISDTGDTQMMYPGEDYTFEGNSVTEYPVAQTGINQLDAQPLKKLNQLLNFTNYNDMANAKKGKKIPKAQAGNIAQNVGKASQGPQNEEIKKLLTPQNISSGIQAGSRIGQAVQRVIQAVEEKKMAKQTRALADPVAKAAATRDVDAPAMLARQVQANRPEYNLLTANDLGGSQFGSGYDVLGMAQNGAEIQNTFAPNTIYDDMGYEPLDESSKVKQYGRGGGVPKAQLGTTLNLIGQGANLAGDIIAGIIGMGTKRMNEQSNQMLGQAAFQSGMQGVLGGQYGSYMKSGGDVGDEYKWVSHNWQPQVITKFGEHSVKDLLQPDPMMNTLRAGGHLKEYTPPSERAMSTERPQFAMGGQLNTHWGGDTELVSYNPYMPGSGETHMARGLYHSQSDGKGKTGIGMSYGNSIVEVENGEPIVEMQEGGSVEDNSAVVFGNLKIPSYVASELGDKDAKGKMFKSYVADLSKKEAKQSKVVDKALDVIDNSTGNSPFDLLALNTAKAMLTGVDIKMKEIAQKKMTAAGAQQAMHEAADEQGIDVEQFINRGKIVQSDKKNTAQVGKSILNKPEFMQRVDFNKPLYTPQGIPQLGDVIKDRYSVTGVVPEELSFQSDYYSTPENEPFGGYDMATPVKIPSSINDMVSRAVASVKSTKGEDKKKMNPWDIAQMAYNELLPFIRPVNQMGLDPSQTMGEKFALFTNVLEPVQAQFYQPMLEGRAPKMTAQDTLNRNQADFNAMARQIGNNPAAMSMLAAQKQMADRQAIAQVEAANIQQEMATRNRNIASLNDATIRNLATADAQYVRQSGARSATKAQAQAALNSIASKIGQNKLENLQSAVMQNMYNYRFGPKGRIMNYNPLAQFNIPQVANLTEEERKELQKQLDKFKDKTAKNGSIVKALKNL